MKCPACGFYQHWFRDVKFHGLGLPMDVKCPRCGTRMDPTEEDL